MKMNKMLEIDSKTKSANEEELILSYFRQTYGRFSLHLLFGGGFILI